MASKRNSSRDGNRSASRRTSSKPVSSDANTSSSISRLSSSSSTRLSLEEAQLEEVKARENRSRDDELQYFTVETQCKGCKKKLTAQVVELHGRLTCPRCQTIMHMGPDGKWHKGPPPTFILKAPKITRWHRLCYRFPLLRKRSVQAGAVLAFLALIVVIALAILSDPKVELSPEVVPRSQGVFEFVMAGDDRKFQQFLASGTEEDGANWFDGIHTSIEHHQSQNYVVSVESVESVFEDLNQGRAKVQVTLHFRRGSEELTLPVLLFWNRDADQGWVLDGTETLKRVGAEDSRSF